jgi:hypothetical protein
VDEPPVVRIERTGPAVLRALADLAPVGSCAAFATEMRAALHSAQDELDLAGPDAVLTRWWVVASVAANPLSADEQATLQRVRTADLGGLYSRSTDSVWERCR